MLSTQWFTEDWLDQIPNSKKLKMVIRVNSGPFMFYSRIISLRIKWPKVLFYSEIFVCFCSFRKLTGLRLIKQNAISSEDYVLIGCPLVVCCHSTIIPIPKEEWKGTFSADSICHDERSYLPNRQNVVVAVAHAHVDIFKTDVDDKTTMVGKTAGIIRLKWNNNIHLIFSEYKSDEMF